MYKVTCNLADGSRLTEVTKNPAEVVRRYFSAYGEEVLSVVVSAEEKQFDKAQVRALP